MKGSRASLPPSCNWIHGLYCLLSAPGQPQAPCSACLQWSYRIVSLIGAFKKRTGNQLCYRIVSLIGVRTRQWKQLETAIELRRLLVLCVHHLCWQWSLLRKCFACWCVHQNCFAYWGVHHLCWQRASAEVFIVYGGVHHLSLQWSYRIVSLIGAFMKGSRASQAFRTPQKEFVPPIWRVLELSKPSEPLKRSLFHLYEGF